MINPNKAVSAKPYGIIVSYTDTQKHYKVDYEPSRLTTQQIYGNQSKAATSFRSTKQKQLLNQAMHGLRSFSQKELEAMSKAEKHQVVVLYSKAQRAINHLKNEVLQAKLNGILKTVFYKSSLAKDLAEFEASEELYYKNNMSLKELHITEDMIIDKLISFKVFSKNYISLT